MDACRGGAVWGDVARRVALWERCGEERNSMGEMGPEVDEYGADAAKGVMPRTHDQILACKNKVFSL